MTQTVPDISPLMPMHQDPLLVIYNGWQPGVDGLRLKLVINRWTIDVKPINSRTPIWPVDLYTPTAWLTLVTMIIQLISTRCKQSTHQNAGWTANQSIRYDMMRDWSAVTHTISSLLTRTVTPWKGSPLHTHRSSNIMRSFGIFFVVS